jgi:ABC-type nitrate/sulfonate/bicarbonate transport system substrate-binding protein
MPSLATAPAPSSPVAAPSSPAPLEAWFSRCPTASPFSIALHLGWIDAEFATEPVVFRALQTSRDPKVHHAHYAHNIPNLFRHGGNFPATWAQAAGADTRVIGLSWKYQSNLVLALPGSGIRTPADLKGKRLLFVRRPKEDIDFTYATALRTYDPALARAGLSLADTRPVELHVERSLVSDRVQHGSPGYVTFNTHPTGGRGTENIWGLLDHQADAIVGGAELVETLGLHVVFDSKTVAPDRQFNNGTPDVFAVNAALIKARPDFVARVYARALQAAEWARNNPVEALRFVAKEQGRAEHQTARSFGSELLSSLDLDLAPRHIEALRSIKTFLLRHRIIPRDFDLDAWIDPTPLAAAKAIVERRRGTPRYQSEIAPGAFRLPSTLSCAAA